MTFEIPDVYYWSAEMYPEPEEYDEDEIDFWGYVDPSEMVENGY
jgi:hypothetical protein